jgi:hypothetical protein
MRIRFARLSVLATLIAALGMLGVSAVPASAEGTKCDIGGEWNIRPGVTETPHAQTIKIRGSLGPCTGAFAKGAQYRATLKTTPVTCAGLASEAERATGTIAIKWTPYAPHSPKTSSGTFTLQLKYEAAVSLSGTIERGAFAAMSISGTGYEVWGPEACGFRHGSFTEVPRSEFVLM